MLKRKRTAQGEDGKASSDRRTNRKFLVFYVTTLFLAAAVLILLSYLVQARNDNQTLNALNEEHQNTAVSALEKVQQMQEENEALTEENEALTQELQEMRSDLGRTQQQLETRQRTITQQEEALDAQRNALTRLWMLERAYQRGDYSACRTLLEEMEQADDAAVLPEENPVEEEAESPLDRYEAILNYFE